MNNQGSSDKHLNRLIQFRQAVYRSGFTKLRDTQLELVGSLLLSRPISSFLELGLSPVFRCQLPSAYAALEEGSQDTLWLKERLCSQVPSQGLQVFTVDGTTWPSPQAPTLSERRYFTDLPRSLMAAPSW